MGLLVFVIGLAISAWLFWWENKQAEEPKPHFIISLQMGDSPRSTVFLTNDFFFKQSIKNAGDLTPEKWT
jgi:hypothetical protein